jgi:hypothetical protein
MHGELFDIQDETDGFPVGIAPVDHREGEHDRHAALHLAFQCTGSTRAFAQDERAEIPVLEHDHPPISGPLRRFSVNPGEVEDRNKLAGVVRQARHESGGKRELLEWLTRQDIRHFTLRNRKDRAEGFELGHFDCLMPEHCGKPRIG